jgi:hypothetical protein
MPGIRRMALLGLAIGMCTPAVLAQATEDALSAPAPSPGCFQL